MKTQRLRNYARTRRLLGLGARALSLMIAIAALFHFFWVDWVTYIVPEAFRGPAIVVFGEAGAPEPERRWWSTVYRIPESGILFVPAPGAEEGLVRDRYYFERADGTLDPIPRWAERDDVQVLWPRLGVGPRVIEGTPVPVDYFGFIVGTPGPYPSDPYAELVETAARLRHRAM